MVIAGLAEGLGNVIVLAIIVVVVGLVALAVRWGYKKWHSGKPQPW